MDRIKVLNKRNIFYFQQEYENKGKNEWSDETKGFR